jgi:uncharacterized membrane protein
LLHLVDYAVFGFDSNAGLDGCMIHAWLHSDRRCLGILGNCVGNCLRMLVMLVMLVVTLVVTLVVMLDRVILHYSTKSREREREGKEPQEALHR